MAEFWVNKVVRELEVEEVFSVQCAVFSVGEELGEDVFEILQVVTELEGGVVGEELLEQRGVYFGNGSRVYGVGVNGNGDSGAGDVDGYVAMEEVMPVLGYGF